MLSSLALLGSRLALGLVLAVPPDAVYDLDLGKVGRGTESVRMLRGEGGPRLTSAVQVALGQGTLRLDQDASLAGAPSRVERYVVSVRAPGQEAVLRATRTPTGWKLEAAPAGDPTQGRSREMPTSGESVVLDNFLASQVDLFVRGLDLPPGGESRVTAVVPQALVAAPMTVRRLQDGKGELAGTPVVLRRYRLDLGSTLMEVECSASDGALLRARVPVQGVTYLRRGFTPPADPPPVPEEDARERAVTVSGPAVGLPGLLLVPDLPKGPDSPKGREGPRPVPAVVLLPGSGPQDRDETVGTNKPLRDLARGFGDRGIASLRYDKRTFVKRDPAVAPNLAREYVEDARAALALLRATPGIDPARLFVVGHSLGGSVAPLVAAEGGVRGIVMLAPMVRRADEILLDQIPFQLRLVGTDEDEIERRRGQIATYFASLADPAADPGPFFGAAAPYWRDWLRLDVPRLVDAAEVPILVLQGGKDVQVRADADFERLRREVGAQDGRVAYRLFPELNHLFQPVEGPSTGAEYGIPGVVAPQAIAVAADWILSH